LPPRHVAIGNILAVIRPPAMTLADRRRTQSRESLAMLPGFGNSLRF
jgi:hypothetical protein